MPSDEDQSERTPRAAGDGARPFSNLRAFAIAFGALNALAAAAAVFGAIVYVGEAEDRQLQRETFQALAVEMLYTRLDRARRTYSDSSDVLARLNEHGIRVSDLDLSYLVFLEPPSQPGERVLLRGERYYVACPVAEGGFLGAAGNGVVADCDRGALTIDVQNPITLDVWRSTLRAPTVYCRTGSTIRFAQTELTRPTFHCTREQVVYQGAAQAPEDTRWRHPDDDPSEPRERAPPVYASGPCAGEVYPAFLGQNVDLGLPEVR